MVAIHDAASAGANPARLSGAWRDVAKGDEAAARGRCELAIECYQHAWNHAVLASTRLTIGRENGGQHIEFVAPARERYEIGVSTNLTDWVILTSGTTGPDGLIRFDDHSAPTNKVRFYRAKLTP